MSYIVFWKDAPGQQVSTTVDANDVPIARDREWVADKGYEVLDDPTQVFQVLSTANGYRYAISVDLARETLGWDL